MKVADGVFSGGGVKALAFAGALKAAENFEYGKWDKLAGTSAGAITAMALATGYSADALIHSLTKFDFGGLADCGRPRRLRTAANLARYRAVMRGEALGEWIESLLEQAPAPVRTFGELDGRLRVVGSDVVNRRSVVFPDDVGRYLDPNGRPWQPEEFPVALAVRISAGYPYVFPPVRMVDAQSGVEAALVDGGLVGSYPVFLFDKLNPVQPTWGFRLHDADVKPRGLGGLRWPLQMIRSVLDTSMHALDALQLRAFEERTIWIPTGDVPTLEFNLTNEQKDSLRRSGFRAAHDFFAAAPSGRNSLGALPPPSSLPSVS